MNKFRVGDKVKIKSNIKHCSHGLVASMFDLFGTTQIVTHICDDGGITLGCGFTWDPDNLTPYGIGQLLKNE